MAGYNLINISTKFKNASSFDEEHYVWRIAFNIWLENKVWEENHKIGNQVVTYLYRQDKNYFLPKIYEAKQKVFMLPLIDSFKEMDKMIQRNNMKSLKKIMRKMYWRKIFKF